MVEKTFQGSTELQTCAELKESEIEELATLHGASLTDSIITSLGIPVLRAYYQFIQNSSDEILFLEKEADRIAGACVLSLSPRSVTTRFVRAHPFLFAFNLAKRCILSADKRARIFSALVSKTEQPSKTLSIPEVIQIFTDPAQRNKQIGTKLILQVERYLAGQNQKSYFVKTAAAEDNQALVFYARREFSPVGEAVMNGKRYIYLTKAIA